MIPGFKKQANLLTDFLVLGKSFIDNGMCNRWLNYIVSLKACGEAIRPLHKSQKAIQAEHNREVESGLKNKMQK